jgi:hypothetical protein
MSLRLVVILLPACATTLQPVPWLKLQTRTRTRPAITVPAGPGGLMGVRSYSERWSYLYLRASSGWTRIPIDPDPEMRVFGGGHSVLIRQSGKDTVYRDGKAVGKALPDELLGIRKSDDHIVFAYCGRDEGGRCHRMQVREYDDAGDELSSYSSDVSPEDWWSVEGLTTHGVLAHAGARSCTELPERRCRNVRCQVAELSPAGAHLLASAEVCAPEWFAQNLAAHRVAEVAPWSAPRP